MKQLIIVAVKGLHTQILCAPALPAIIGLKKAELIKSGNWRGFALQIRTENGYKHVPILTKKPKNL